MSAETKREALKEEMGVVAWREVAPHYDRGTVFVVAGDTSLLDVGVALAMDDTASVRSWLEDGRLARLDPESAQQWDSDGAPPLTVLVVAPYVLIQPVDTVPN